jgi:PAS domain S-box-containing protein
MPMAPSHAHPTSDALENVAHRTHLWFLESMDRVHRAIQGTNDIDEMMSDVLDAVISIFGCDRALLSYPCDPRASTFRIPMRRTTPAYACPADRDVAYPVDSDIVDVYRATRAAGRPISIGETADRAVPSRLRADFGVRSALLMAVFPKGDEPYHFVLHQCSHPRTWSADEQRLFLEIGRRLADALTTMSTLRELRRSEIRLEEAQRITHAAYTDRDVATSLITTSDEGLRILGMPPGARVVHLRDVLERIHPLDRARVSRVASDQEGDAGRYDMEFRVLGVSGDVRLIHSRGEIIRDEDGAARRVVGIVQDVTEHKRVEYLMRQVFESSPDALAIVGRDYRYQRVNQVYEQTWNLARGPIVGRHASQVIGQELFDGIAKPNLDRCFSGEEVRYANWIESTRGPVFAAVTYTPLRPNSDRVESALVLITDLTEHMRAQEALQKAQADLAHMARVTTLAEIGASIAHEVNQPLTAIVMNGNASRRWLAADPPNLGEARYALQRIIADGNRASQVIARIRGLLRRGEPCADPFGIDELIQDTVALVHGELSRREISIRHDLRARGRVFIGDRVQIQQVLVNLILNGADAMDAVPAAQRRLAIRSRTQDDGGVAVDVEDAGAGFSADDAARIFDGFFSTKPNGLGMGLSISRSIIEAHGGRLWATPNAGAGVTFHFTLPPPS